MKHELLQGLRAIVCVSKLTGKPMSTYHGQVLDNVSDVKRGVRANTNLNLHEAFYLELESNGLIEAFRRLNKGVYFSTHQLNEIKRSIEYFERYLKMANRTPEDIATYQGHLEILRMAQTVEDGAKERLASYGNKNVHWNNLTSVQFFQYDKETNQMVEFDHSTKAKKGS
ncbi:hypothetical protein [Pectobacterium phage Wc4-1]|uniref:Uncharacterized protein n=1 Tax=Pectobacterium phage Wc4 TaxID=2652428 RepID=A0A5P8D4D0_9CAUD|nr:hypothetical protein [Pectobacterium phage Wc4]QFP93989.1 hypothetical protein [Pectobacterium phage Wc4-1]